MAQFNPSQILSQLPPRRRNTLVDYDPVGLTDVTTPSDTVLLASMAGAVAKQAANAYVQSQKDAMEYNLKSELQTATLEQKDRQINLQFSTLDYTKNKDDDVITRDMIRNANYKNKESMYSTINMLTNPGERKFMTDKFDKEIYPKVERIEYLENEFQGKTVNEILDITAEDGTKIGNRLLDEYSDHIRSVDKIMPIDYNDTTKKLIDDYNEHKGFYSLVQDDEEFKKRFGLTDEDFDSIKRLTGSTGESQLLLLMKNKNPDLDDDVFKKKLAIMKDLHTGISNNSEQIRGMISEINADPTKSQRVLFLQGQIERIETDTKLKEAQIKTITETITLPGVDRPKINGKTKTKTTPATTTTDTTDVSRILFPAAATTAESTSRLASDTLPITQPDQYALPITAPDTLTGKKRITHNDLETVWSSLPSDATYEIGDYVRKHIIKNTQLGTNSINYNTQEWVDILDKYKIYDLFP